MFSPDVMSVGSHGVMREVEELLWEKARLVKDNRRLVEENSRL